MEQVTSSNGVVIGFERSGTGPPLVLVHGTTADHRRWDRLLAHFTGRFTVYAMDRRGRGGSSDSPDYHLLREAEDVAALVEAACDQAGEPVYLVGHSHGGLCSLEAALLTDKIRRLVLYEPPLPTGQIFYPPGLPERMQALIDSGEEEGALEAFMREVVGMPEAELESYRRLPMWEVRVRLAHTIPRELTIDRAYRFDAEKFAALRVPTLLLLGSESPPVFRQAIEAIHSALPASRVTIMMGQRHVAMDTAPEMFVNAVLTFLLEEPAARESAAKESAAKEADAKELGSSTAGAEE